MKISLFNLDKTVKIIYYTLMNDEISKSELDYYKYRVTLLREQVDLLKESIGYSLPHYVNPIVNNKEVVDILKDIRENINTFLQRCNVE